MKFDKAKIEESTLKEGDFDVDGEMDFEDETMLGETEYAEIEMVAAEPTKVTDIDGSVVIVSPGDILTIKSESLKRVRA